MNPEISSLRLLLLRALSLSLIAGDAIMDIYSRSDFNVEMKEDNSPLTLADKTSNSIIVDGVIDLGIPVLSEEGSQISWEIRKDWDKYWLIDPLDGTKEFIKRNDEFTVNIALMEKNVPVLGVVYLPVLKELYFALKDHGAYKFEKVEQRDVDEGFEQVLSKSKKLPDKPGANGVRVVASRSHLSKETEDFISKLRIKEKNITLVPAGSSLKLCLIAEGKADVYPRMGPTMEWDIAAGHVIINESGGSVLTLNDTPLKYNKPDLLNPWFIARSKLFRN